MAAIVALVRREGLLGWLSGIIPALILLINPAIQLAVYGWLRKWVQRKRGAAPRATDAFVMGAVSKFFGNPYHFITHHITYHFLLITYHVSPSAAVILTFPAQTIKLRMQAGLTGPEGSIWRAILAANTVRERLRLIR